LTEALSFSKRPHRQPGSGVSLQIVFLVAPDKTRFSRTKLRFCAVFAFSAQRAVNDFWGFTMLFHPAAEFFDTLLWYFSPLHVFGTGAPL
jgi:hypothetical protein